MLFPSRLNNATRRSARLSFRLLVLLVLACWRVGQSGGTPCETSVIEQSHHDPVYDVFWISAKSGNLCASVSTDGRMLWWDTRRLSEPTEVLQLDTGDGTVLGGSSLEYVGNVKNVRRTLISPFLLASLGLLVSSLVGAPLNSLEPLLVHTPLVRIPLVHIPLVHVPLVHTPLVRIPLVHIPLVHIPLVHILLVHIVPFRLLPLCAKLWYGDCACLWRMSIRCMSMMRVFAWGCMDYIGIYRRNILMVRIHGTHTWYSYAVLAYSKVQYRGGTHQVSRWNGARRGVVS